jgi:hypothetical protein
MSDCNCSRNLDEHDDWCDVSPVNRLVTLEKELAKARKVVEAAKRYLSAVYDRGYAKAGKEYIFLEGAVSEYDTPQAGRRNE